MSIFERKPTDDQQRILEALLEGSYKKVKPSLEQATTYMTLSGITFAWLHGLGDGKTVKVEDVIQPEWFAKMVRKGVGHGKML